jgi:hypothetical protein
MNRSHRLLAATILLLAVVLTLLLAPALASGKSANPGVIPVQSNPFGDSYGEWGAAWWHWAYSLPLDGHPLYVSEGDAGGGQPVSSRVWFLGGVYNESGIAVRTMEVPAGKALFFPVLNVVASTLTGDGSTETELRAVATAIGDIIVDPQMTSMSAEVDGVEIAGLTGYRAQSELFSYGPLPENNILGLEAGLTSPAVSDGVYLMLAPLPVGEHTVHFSASIPEFGFSLDITYHLAVAAPR